MGLAALEPEDTMAASVTSLEPATGRTHQLRVHAASGLGLPIVGDPVYGRKGPAMLLHAWSLSLPRPK